jgi:hypothetical protein
MPTPFEIANMSFDSGYRACIEDLQDYPGRGLVTDDMIAYLEAIFKKARAEK